MTHPLWIEMGRWEKTWQQPIINLIQQQQQQHNNNHNHSRRGDMTLIDYSMSCTVVPMETGGWIDHCGTGIGPSLVVPKNTYPTHDAGEYPSTDQKPSSLGGINKICPTTPTTKMLLINASRAVSTAPSSVQYHPRTMSVRLNGFGICIAIQGYPTKPIWLWMSTFMVVMVVVVVEKDNDGG